MAIGDVDIELGEAEVGVAERHGSDMSRWTENNGTDFRTKTKRCFMSYPLTLQCTRLLKVSLLRVSLLRDSFLLRMGS